MTRSRLALNLGVAVLLMVGLWVTARQATRAVLSRTGRPAPSPAPKPPAPPRGPGTVYADNGTPQDLVLVVDGKRWGVVPAYRAVSLDVPEGWHRFVALVGDAVFDEVRACVEMGRDHIFNPGQRNQYREAQAIMSVRCRGSVLRVHSPAAPPTIIGAQWFDGYLPVARPGGQPGWWWGPRQMRRLLPGRIPLPQALAVVGGDRGLFESDDSRRAEEVLVSHPPRPDIGKALLARAREEGWVEEATIEAIESRYALLIEDRDLRLWLEQGTDPLLALAVRQLMGRGRSDVLGLIFLTLKAERRVAILRLLAAGRCPVPPDLRAALVADLRWLLLESPPQHPAIIRALADLGAVDALVPVLSQVDRQALSGLAAELVQEGPVPWKDGPPAIDFATALLRDPDQQIRWWSWRFLVGRMARRPDLRETLSRAASREPDSGLQSYVLGQLERSAPRD